jgi:hypothetical protein
MEREEIEAALDVWAAMELPDRDTLWRGAIDQSAGQVTADSTHAPVVHNPARIESPFHPRSIRMEIGGIPGP